MDNFNKERKSFMDKIEGLNCNIYNNNFLIYYFNEQPRFQKKTENYLQLYKKRKILNNILKKRTLKLNN